MASTATRSVSPSKTAVVHGPPLDYAFLGLKNVLDVLDEKPFRGTRKAPPRDPMAASAGSTGSSASKRSGSPTAPAGSSATGRPQHLEGVRSMGGGAAGEGSASTSKSASGSGLKVQIREISTGLKLSNNQLQNVKDLPTVLAEIMHNPSDLTFLDLSFNQLTEIDDVITRYPKLSSLYLHANKIADIKQVDKLRGLPLRALTLQANPLEEKNKDTYRLYVIATLPTLRTLDFSPVTSMDRERAKMMRRR